MPILLIEDDESSRTATALALTQAGFSVVTADDGQQAINLLEDGLRPRLIIVDMMLPRVSGQDVVRYVSDDPVLRTVPRIVTTGLPREQVRAIADVTLFKPISPARLIADVKRLLAAR